MINIDEERCNGCGECVSICPLSAISLQDDKAFIDSVLCNGCEACLSVCPLGAVLSIEVLDAEIETYCREHAIEIAGQIPFDLVVTEAMVQGEPVTAYRPDSPASQALRDVWARVLGVLGEVPR